MTESDARRYAQELLDNPHWREDQEIAMGRKLTLKELRAIAENQACAVWEGTQDDN